jgi:hypothetical protein
MANMSCASVLKHPCVGQAVYRVQIWSLHGRKVLEVVVLVTASIGCPF